MTGKELLAIARAGRPTVRYAITTTGNAIGAWSDAHQRFVVVAAETITGKWASMPHELLINGQPIPHEWLEA